MRVFLRERTGATAASRILLLLFLIGVFADAFCGFELHKDLVGAFYYAGRHTGELGDVDAETVFAASGGELAEEHNLAVDFLDGDIEVCYAAV